MASAAASIVDVGGNIGCGLPKSSPYFSITEESVRLAINSQFAGYIRDDLLAGNDLTNLSGAPDPSGSTALVSFAPLRFQVDPVSGGLDATQMVRAVNELLAAVEATGGANLRLEMSASPALSTEYKLVIPDWVCCASIPLLIDRDGSYVPATFTAVEGSLQVPAELRIEVGWALPVTAAVHAGADREALR